MKDYSFLPSFDERTEDDLEELRVTHALWKNLMAKIEARDSKDPTNEARNPIKLATGENSYEPEDDIFLVGQPEILVFPISKQRCAVGVHKLVIDKKPEWFCASWGWLDDDMDDVGRSGADREPISSMEEYHDGSDLLVLPKAWSELIRLAIQSAQETGRPMVWPNDPANGQTLIDAIQTARNIQLDKFLLDNHRGGSKLIRQGGFLVFRTVIARLFILALLDQGVGSAANEIHKKELLFDKRLADLIDENEKRARGGLVKKISASDRYDATKLKQILDDKPSLWWVYADQDLLKQTSPDCEPLQSARKRGRSL